MCYDTNIEFHFEINLSIREYYTEILRKVTAFFTLSHAGFSTLTEDYELTAEL